MRTSTGRVMALLFVLIAFRAPAMTHYVDLNSTNASPPFTNWATAATNIQDAIDASVAGETVLVTNGVYATGGKVMAGDLTNRVALDRPITVTSVNGYSATVIQGAWDPVATNGPGAVRCAHLADGAVLYGFTLQNGATRPFSGYLGAPAESGGGAWCTSTNGLVSNCLLTSNSAVYGGGISRGTLNNSLVVHNVAAHYGGGAYFATLNHCTVVCNYTKSPMGLFGGAGTYEGITRNSIVLGNFYGHPDVQFENNYGPLGVRYYFSCTSPTQSGTGNTNVNPQLLDWCHISASSPCRGAGWSAYSSGTDLDGEPWADPPSMGCDEVIPTNLLGHLSVNVLAFQTNLLVNRSGFFSGIVTGRASRVEWSFGDGPAITNSGSKISHQWTNSGDYLVTFAAYNNDNPNGVATNLAFHVLPMFSPQLQSVLLTSNNMTFQFTGQQTAYYTVQYGTNLTPPVTWQTLQGPFNSDGGMHQITDYAASNEMRFYRVLAQ